MAESYFINLIFGLIGKLRQVEMGFRMDVDVDKRTHFRLSIFLAVDLLELTALIGVTQQKGFFFNSIFKSITRGNLMAKEWPNLIVLLVPCLTKFNQMDQ